MTTNTPAHDFLAPRLAELVANAVSQGLDRDVVVAVLIDLITKPPFTTDESCAEPEEEMGQAPGPSADDPVLVGGVSVAAPREIGDQDVADFTRNPTWQE
jgi:hypothetical protein